MRKSLIFVVFVSFLLSCNSKEVEPCSDECFPITSAVFRVISVNDGKDLVFGSNKTYDKKAFKFYSLKGNDTTYFDFQFYYAVTGKPDSSIGVFFEPGTITAYWQLNSMDIDTLTISYKTIHLNCCLPFNSISDIRVNDTTFRDVLNNIIVVKK